MIELTQKRLREVLRYDPATGAFTRVKTGAKAGAIRPDGYVQISVDRRLYRASRLAWLYSYGVQPPSMIDHINGQPADNRLVNLRAATPRENRWNAKTKTHNRSGYKGVQCESSGRFSARITFGGKIRRIGIFDTPDEAHLAYCRAAEKHFGEFANTGGVPCQ